MVHNFHKCYRLVIGYTIALDRTTILVSWEPRSCEENFNQTNQCEWLVAKERLHGATRPSVG